MWLAEFKQGEIPWHHMEKPTTYRDVAAERLVPSLKIGDRMESGMVHRAGDLEAGDALLRRRVNNGDYFRPWEQLWIGSLRAAPRPSC